MHGNSHSIIPIPAGRKYRTTKSDNRGTKWGTPQRETLTAVYPGGVGGYTYLYIYICIYIHLFSISLSLSLFEFVYIYICILYIYIFYIFIEYGQRPSCESESSFQPPAWFMIMVIMIGARNYNYMSNLDYSFDVFRLAFRSRCLM